MSKYRPRPADTPPSQRPSSVRVSRRAGASSSAIVVSVVLFIGPPWMIAHSGGRHGSAAIRQAPDSTLIFSLSPRCRAGSRPWGRRPAAGVGALARCTARDPCPAGSESASCRAGSGSPAPCRNAPRPPARGRSAVSSRSPVPQRFGSEKRRSDESSRSGQHEREDLVVIARAHRGRADVVGPAVLAVEPEQERREPVRLLLPADANHDAVGRLVLLDLDDAFPRAGQVGQAEPLRDHAVEPRRLEAVEPRGRRSSSRVAGEIQKPSPRRSSSSRRSSSGRSCTGCRPRAGGRRR